MSDQWPAFSFPDQVARMPAQAQRKYRKLASELEDAVSLLDNHMLREKDASARVFGLSRSVERAARPGGDPGKAARLAAERDQAQADYQELLATRGRLNARHDELSNIVSRLRHNEIAQIHGWLHPVDVAARPKPGEDLVQAIERTRDELRAKQGELAAVRQAPLPRAELLAMCRTAVSTLALQGQPVVVSHGGKFEVRWDRVAVPGFPQAADVLVPKLLAALFPKQLLALLEAQVPDRPGLSAAERAERVGVLERQILRLEHEEESLVVAAQAKGLAAPRRRDASAFALLGCDPGEWHVLPAQAAE